MSNRNGGVARVVQKKLRRIRKEILKKEEVQSILDELDEKPPIMDFLFNEDAIDKYGEDVTAFKSDADACLKFFSKIRGKKKESADISSSFASLLSQEFPDVYPLDETNDFKDESINRKRGRSIMEPNNSSEIATGPPEKKKSSHVVKEASNSSLSLDEKNTLKSMVNKLWKCPDSEFFKYPVDIKVYPEYYDQIEHPVDLSSIKKKINSAEYTSVSDVLRDLRLISENCHIFNAEGSDILLTVDRFALFLEEVVEEELGSEYVLKRPRKSVVGVGRKKKGGSNNNNKANELEDDNNDDDNRGRKEKQREPLILTIRTTSSNNNSNNVATTAASLLSSASTPNSKQQKKKINLRLLHHDSEGNEDGISEEEGGDDDQDEEEEEEKDMYDHSSSSSRKKKIVNRDSSKMKPHSLSSTVVATATSSSSSSVVQWPRHRPLTQIIPAIAAIALTPHNMKNIVKEVSDHPLAAPFSIPVDPREAPGYLDFIEQPMDLSTVRKRVNQLQHRNNSTEYYNSCTDAASGAVAFVRDMRLIWENCLQYNDPTSGIAAEAMDLGDHFELTLQKLLSSVTPQASSTSLLTQASKDSRGSSKKLKIATAPIDMEIADDDEEDDDEEEEEEEEGEDSEEEIALDKAKKLVKDVVVVGQKKRGRGKTMKKMAFPSKGKGNYDDDNDGNEANTDEDEKVSRKPTKTTRMELSSATGRRASAASAKLVTEEDDDEDGDEDELIAGKTAGTAAVEASSAEKKKRARVPVEDDVRKIRAIIRDISGHELAGPFLFPVPADMIPGYAEVITHPMDMHTIKKKVNTFYDKDVSLFLNDMRLVFDNCQTFNIEGSELYKAAGILKDIAVKKIYKAFPSLDPIQQVAVTPVATTSLSVGVKKVVTSQSSVTALTVGSGNKMSDNNSISSLFDPQLPSLKSLLSSLFPSKGTSSSSSNKQHQHTQPTLDDLNTLCKELNSCNYSSSSNATHPYLRDKLATKAADLLKVTTVPFVAAPSIYVVKDFGEDLIDINSNSASSSSSSVVAASASNEVVTSEIVDDVEAKQDRLLDPTTYIYPTGYTCSRTMRICIIPDGSSSLATNGSTSLGYTAPFVPVDLKSSIIAVPTVASSLSSSSRQKTHQQQQLRFVVSLENGTVISEADSPKLAWEGIFGRENDILHMLGSKLRRCRAVFNRLCVSPDAIYFLEQIALTGPIGPDYYAVITAPMWLREVHARLIHGLYDVEFDFAWDMRLIFKNCMEYNTQDSDVYQAAVRLSDLFEHFFVNWVLNIQDKSLTDMAKGPWDQWMYLKHFDAVDAKENFCAVTGTRVSSSMLLQCLSCEDQNLFSLHPELQEKYTSPRSIEWNCSRCSEAIESCSGDLRSNPFTLASSVGKATKEQPQLHQLYSCEDLGGNVYVPAPEIGPVGWCQAKRKQQPRSNSNTSSLLKKNVFLSPLGYEIYTKEDIPLQIEYEQEVNQNLYAARAKEFQENTVKSNKPRKEQKKTTRHHLRNKGDKSELLPASPEKAAQLDNSSSTNSSNSDSSITATVASINILPGLEQLGSLEEEGRITTGKLHNFTTPPGFRLAWFGCANEDLILQKTAAGKDVTALLEQRCEITSASMPATGYFGLNVPSIRRRLEGVEALYHNSSNSMYKNYRHMDAESMRKEIFHELDSHRRKFESYRAGEEILNKTLLEERWKFDLEMLIPVPPTKTLSLTATVPTTTTTTVAATTTSSLQHQHQLDVNTRRHGFHPLLPPNITTHQADALLCTWEFLYAHPELRKSCDVFSFYDLTCSVVPRVSASLLPYYGQAVFDEIGCAFTEALLLELRHRGNYEHPSEQQEWQDILFVRPVNVITWQHIALELIRLFSLPLTAAELRAVIAQPNINQQQHLRDMLCLLYNHPLIDIFLQPSSSSPLSVRTADRLAATRKHVLFSLGGNTKRDDSATKSVALLSKVESNETMEDSIPSVNNNEVKMMMDEEDSSGSSSEDQESDIFNDLASLAAAIREIFSDEVQEQQQQLTSSEDPQPTPQRLLYAMNILQWLDALYLRWGIILPPVNTTTASSFTTTTDIATLFNSVDSSRYWGGYTLGNPTKVPHEHVLTLDSFVRQANTDKKNCYDEGMSALNNLEKTLSLFSRSDPEDWYCEDKITIYLTMMDYATATYSYASAAQEKHQTITKKLSSLADVSLAPSATISTLLSKTETIKTPTGKNTKCFFTGVSADQVVDKTTAWVNVPTEYQPPPPPPPPVVTEEILPAIPFPVVAVHGTRLASSASSTTSSSQESNSNNTVKSSVVALKSAMIKVMVAREKARLEKIKFEDRVDKYLMQTLDEDVKNLATSTLAKRIPTVDSVDDQRSMYYPSQPMGYDRYGNAYWLFSVQERCTLFPFHPNSLSLAKQQNAITGAVTSPIEPCVLMREPGINGWWGFNDGLNIPSLLRSFSNEFSCEHILRLRMIEKLAYTRCYLRRSTLNIKILQREWYERRIRCEQATNQLKLTEEMTILQKNRLLEVAWARYYEIRQVQHYAVLYRNEEDPNARNTIRSEREGLLRRQRLMREACLANSFDHHLVHGWGGYCYTGNMTRIRQLASICTATQILAEPSSFALLQNTLKLSVYLKKPSPPSLPTLPPAVITAATTTATVATGPATTATASSSIIIAPVTEESRTSKILETVGSEESASTLPTATATVGVPADDAAATTVGVAAADIAATTTVGVAAVVEETKEVNAASSDRLDAMPALQKDATVQETVMDVVVTDSVPVSEEAKPQPPLASGTSPIAANILSTEAAAAQNLIECLAAAYAAFNKEPLLPDLRGFITANALPSAPPHMRNKAIEQLHLITGEVLRIHPSGKDAALFMEISQSGISLCLHDTKPDYFGYRWRYYEGPAINFDALKDVQIPYAAVKELQLVKNRRADYNSIEEKQRLARVLWEAKQVQIKKEYYEVRGIVATNEMLAPSYPTSNNNNNSNSSSNSSYGNRMAAISGPNSSNNLQYDRNRPYLTATAVAGTSALSRAMPPSTALTTTATLLSSSSQLTTATSTLPANHYQPHIITSTAVVSARMLKLKADLLNIFYILPEKILKLPELDEEAEKTIQATGLEAAATIRAGVAKMASTTTTSSLGTAATSSIVTRTAAATSSTSKIDTVTDNAGAEVGLNSTDNSIPSQSNVDRIADKAARKAKRRMRRKLSMEQFLRDVQSATTPSQLLRLTIGLEEAIPSSSMFVNKYKYQLPFIARGDPDINTTITLSSVAMRIYILDRSIAYDELKGAETAATQCPFKLRVQYFPRCVQSSICVKPLNHEGRCDLSGSMNGSRVPEILDQRSGFSYAAQQQSQYHQQHIMLANRAGIPGGSNVGNTPAAMHAAAMQAQQRRMAYGQNGMLSMQQQQMLHYQQQQRLLQPKDEDLPIAEIIKKLLHAKKELDIENVQPYVPAVTDIVRSDWI